MLWRQNHSVETTPAEGRKIAVTSCPKEEKEENHNP
jgi:hypothetical protein